MNTDFKDVFIRILQFRERGIHDEKVSVFTDCDDIFADLLFRAGNGTVGVESSCCQLEHSG